MFAVHGPSSAVNKPPAWSPNIILEETTTPLQEALYCISSSTNSFFMLVQVKKVMKMDESGKLKNLGGYSEKAGCFFGGSMKMKSQKATKSHEANVVN